MEKVKERNANCCSFHAKWMKDCFVQVKISPHIKFCGDAPEVRKKSNLERHYRTKHVKQEELKGPVKSPHFVGVWMHNSQNLQDHRATGRIL